jgi:hypothetical protein
MQTKPVFHRLGVRARRTAPCLAPNDSRKASVNAVTPEMSANNAEPDVRPGNVSPGTNARSLSCGRQVWMGMEYL